MTTATWLAFALVALGVSFFPGVVSLAELSISLQRGTAAGLRAMALIVFVDAFLFVLVSGTFGAALSTSRVAMEAVKWIGAAVLAFIGLRILLTRGPSRNVPHISTRAPAIAQFTNAKLYVFLAAVVPPFMSRAHPLLPQLLLLLVTFVMSELCAFTIIAVGAGRVRRFLGSDRHMLWVSRVSGVAIVSAALFLTWEH